MKRVYADYAATTPTDNRVIEAMSPYYDQIFGNPSSIHFFGEQAAQALDKSAQIAAQFFGLEKEEIYFTSGGTESNNLALMGVMRANRSKGNHLITSVIEHPSILNCADALSRDGFEVDYLPVDSNGRINPKDLKKALKKETVLVTVHLANSELGVIQDIPALAKITHQHGAYFHTDACQATSYLSLRHKELDYDLISINGSKCYGPKGIGVLAVKREVPIYPIIYGGGQQRSLRSGTENLPAIVGLSKALEIVEENREADSKKIGLLRDKLQNMVEKIGTIQVNARDAKRLPNHLSLTLTNGPHQNLVKLMDEQGIALSSASACSMRHGTESYVLRAIGLSSERSLSTVRITLGRANNLEDITKIFQALKKLA